MFQTLPSPLKSRIGAVKGEITIRQGESCLPIIGGDYYHRRIICRKSSKNGFTFICVLICVLISWPFVSILNKKQKQRYCHVVQFAVLGQRIYMSGLGAAGQQPANAIASFSNLRVAEKKIIGKDNNNV